MVEFEEEMGDDFVSAKLLISFGGSNCTIRSVQRCYVRMEGKVYIFGFVGVWVVVLLFGKVC